MAWSHIEPPLDRVRIEKVRRDAAGLHQWQRSRRGSVVAHQLLRGDQHAGGKPPTRNKNLATARGWETVDEVSETDKGKGVMTIHGRDGTEWGTATSGSDPRNSCLCTHPRTHWLHLSISFNRHRCRKSWDKDPKRAGQQSPSGGKQQTQTRGLLTKSSLAPSKDKEACLYLRQVRCTPTSLPHSLRQVRSTQYS